MRARLSAPPCDDPQGMASRIGNHIEFPNYSADELVEIGKVMCRELEYDLGPDAEPALRAYMAKRMTMPFFANARTVRSGRCTAPAQLLHRGGRWHMAGRCWCTGVGDAAQALGCTGAGRGTHGTRRTHCRVSIRRDGALSRSVTLCHALADP